MIAGSSFSYAAEVPEDPEIEKIDEDSYRIGESIY